MAGSLPSLRPDLARSPGEGRSPTRRAGRLTECGPTSDEAWGAIARRVARGGSVRSGAKICVGRSRHEQEPAPLQEVAVGDLTGVAMPSGHRARRLP